MDVPGPGVRGSVVPLAGPQDPLPDDSGSPGWPRGILIVEIQATGATLPAPLDRHLVDEQVTNLPLGTVVYAVGELEGETVLSGGRVDREWVSASLPLTAPGDDIDLPDRLTIEPDHETGQFTVSGVPAG